MCSCAINSIGAIGYLRSFIQSLYDDDDKIVENLNTQYFLVNIMAILYPLIYWHHVLSLYLCVLHYGILVYPQNLYITATWNVLLLILFCVAGLMLFDSQLLTKPCDPDIVKAFEQECPDDADNSFMPFGFEGVIFASTITFWSLQDQKI